MGEDSVIQVGVELLRFSAEDEISVSEAVDRIEAVTTSPRLTRQILSRAEEEGVIARSESAVTITTTASDNSESGIIVEEGDYSCSRCGKGVTKGHFVSIHGSRIGPFGSTCVRKVTGRDPD